MIKIMPIVIIVVGCMGSSFVQAHPYDDYIPNPIPDNYGTAEFRTGPVDAINELTFNSLYPDPGTLTSKEIYIIAGASDASGEVRLVPWINEVGNFLSMFYNNQGYLPEEISEEMLDTWYADSGTVDRWFYDIYKNPITDEYPRLDSEIFSPGDLYVRPLTEDEKHIFAEGNPNLQSIWFEGKINRPGSDNDGAVVVPSPALYVRAYGLNDVIYEMVVMKWAVRVPANGSGFGG